LREIFLSNNFLYTQKLIKVAKFLIVPFLFFFAGSIFAIDVNADLFTFDEKKVEAEFKELSKIESLVLGNPNATIDELIQISPEIEKLVAYNTIPLHNSYEIHAPGKFPSFWFTLIFSAVGTYTLYGAVAGPIAVGIVYFSTHKDKIETKKAIWGCVTGTLIGAGIKLVVSNL
jgi:hypothetical protein